MAKDLILPFYLDQAAVRGRMTFIDTVGQAILGRHIYPEIINHHLLELIALGATLSNAFKYDGVFTLQVKGSDASVSFMVVDIDSKGNIRACAKYNNEAIASIDDPRPSLMTLFGAGHLAFTIDQGAHTERYQGIVELEGNTLRDCLQHYFRQSEQLETSFLLQTAPDGRAACIMIQKLPFDAEQEPAAYDAWFTSLSLLATVRKEEILSRPPEETLRLLFWEQGLNLFDPKPLQFKCRCNALTLKSIIDELSFEERQSISKDGVIEARCEFCNTVYTFPV